MGDSFFDTCSNDICHSCHCPTGLSEEDFELDGWPTSQPRPSSLLRTVLTARLSDPLPTEMQLVLIERRRDPAVGASDQHNWDEGFGAPNATAFGLGQIDGLSSLGESGANPAAATASTSFLGTDPADRLGGYEALARDRPSALPPWTAPTVPSIAAHVNAFPTHAPQEDDLPAPLRRATPPAQTAAAAQADPARRQQHARDDRPFHYQQAAYEAVSRRRLEDEEDPLYSLHVSHQDKTLDFTLPGTSRLGDLKGLIMAETGRHRVYMLFACFPLVGSAFLRLPSRCSGCSARNCRLASRHGLPGLMHHPFCLQQ
jgi:hypothetical protein